MNHEGKGKVERPFILIGAGGHAKVLLSLLLHNNMSLIGICDPGLVKQGYDRWRGIPVLGGDDVIMSFDSSEVFLVNGIGQLPGSRLRQQLFERFQQCGYYFPPLVHSSAWVDPSSDLKAGVQIMAGAIVQADCVIGENSIVNTRASVDHDCQVGANVHIAPGATLCGNVQIGAQAFIGCGSTIIQGRSVGNASVVGAGTTLVKDLEIGQLAIGATVKSRALRK